MMYQLWRLFTSGLFWWDVVDENSVKFPYQKTPAEAGVFSYPMNRDGMSSLIDQSFHLGEGDIITSTRDLLS